MERATINALDNSVAELVVYDEVGWYITARAVRDLLKQLGKVSELHVRINSPGGAVSEGVAIYNVLSEHPAKVIVTVDGFALSAASVIAMAGDEIRMAKGALMMIHEAHAYTAGHAADHDATATILRKINAGLVACYAARTGLPVDEVEKLVAAETWLTADEAVDKGFATAVLPAKGKDADAEPSALWGANGARCLSTYRHLPVCLARLVEAGPRAEEAARATPAVPPAVRRGDGADAFAASGPRSHLGALADSPGIGGLRGKLWT